MSTEAGQVGTQGLFTLKALTLDRPRKVPEILIEWYVSLEIPADLPMIDCLILVCESIAQPRKWRTSAFGVP